MTNNLTNPNDKHNNTSSLPSPAPVVAANAAAATIETIGVPFAKAASKLLVAIRKTLNIIPNALAKEDAKNKAQLNAENDAIKNTADEQTEIAEKVIAREKELAGNLITTGAVDGEIKPYADAQVKNAIEHQNSTGGGRSSIKHIQRGGQQSLKRTAKSINEFLNSSVTASHIINMVKKGGRTKRRLNCHVKKYKTRRQI